MRTRRHSKCKKSLKRRKNGKKTRRRVRVSRNRRLMRTRMRTRMRRNTRKLSGGVYNLLQKFPNNIWSFIGILEKNGDLKRVFIKKDTNGDKIIGYWGKGRQMGLHKVIERKVIGMTDETFREGGPVTGVKLQVTDIDGSNEKNIVFNRPYNEATYKYMEGSIQTLNNLRSYIEPAIALIPDTEAEAKKKANLDAERKAFVDAGKKEFSIIQVYDGKEQVVYTFFLGDGESIDLGTLDRSNFNTDNKDAYVQMRGEYTKEDVENFISSENPSIYNTNIDGVSFRAKFGNVTPRT